MSALPPEADMCAALADVCFVPIADILPPLALRSDERANLAGIGKDYVRTITHHSSIN
jgi:hypothetical protein